VRGDVSVGSDALLVTDFVNLKIKLTQSFGCAYRSRMCVRIFIGLSAHRLSMFVLCLKNVLYSTTVDCWGIKHLAGRVLQSGPWKPKHGPDFDGPSNNLLVPPRNPSRQKPVPLPPPPSGGLVSFPLRTTTSRFVWGEQPRRDGSQLLDVVALVSLWFPPGLARPDPRSLLLILS
jgi:hypothetical protein